MFTGQIRALNSYSGFDNQSKKDNFGQELNEEIDENIDNQDDENLEDKSDEDDEFL